MFPPLKPGLHTPQGKGRGSTRTQGGFTAWAWKGHGSLKVGLPEKTHRWWLTCRRINKIYRLQKKKKKNHAGGLLGNTSGTDIFGSEGKKQSWKERVVGLWHSLNKGLIQPHNNSEFGIVLHGCPLWKKDGAEISIPKPLRHCMWAASEGVWYFRKDASLQTRPSSKSKRWILLLNLPKR